MDLSSEETLNFGSTPKHAWRRNDDPARIVGIRYFGDDGHKIQE